MAAITILACESSYPGGTKGPKFIWFFYRKNLPRLLRWWPFSNTAPVEAITFDISTKVPLDGDISISICELRHDVIRSSEMGRTVAHPTLFSCDRTSPPLLHQRTI